MSDQPGSWQPDPFGRNQYRYWDGSEWTDHVSNDGEVGTDPAVADAVAGADPASDAGEPPADAERGAAEPVPPTNVPAETPAAAVEPDATTSMAAMLPPSPLAPSGPGGPSDPPPPTDPGDGAGAGGNNVTGFVIGAVVLVLLLGAAAWFFLLRDDDDDDLRTEVVAALRSEAGLTGAQAECVADALDDSIGLRGIADGINADRSPTAAEQLAIEDAFAECGVTESPDDTTTTTEDVDDTTTTTEGASPSVSIPSALLDFMVAEMTATSDLTETQARCFAEEFLSLEEIDLAELMADPESFEDAAFADPSLIFAMFGIFERCDIDPMTFDGGFDETGSDTYGDDPALDALWDECEAGDGEACDDLWRLSPVGSRYEEFGDTCGDRVQAGTVFCATQDLD